jgi:hypothetical protein
MYKNFLGSAVFAAWHVLDRADGYGAHFDHGRTVSFEPPFCLFYHLSLYSFYSRK